MRWISSGALQSICLEKLTTCLWSSLGQCLGARRRALGANYAQSTALVMICLALAFFGNGFASQTWAPVAAIAPRRCLGLTGSVFNVFGNLPGIVVPLAVGLLVNGGDFAPALRLIALLALPGQARGRGTIALTCKTSL